jgi:4Fe-4S ferredoxin
MTLVIRNGNEKRELEHINSSCVGCGICSNICPTSALSLGPVLPIARGILEMDYVNINQDKCVLCGLCSFACPFNAIDFKINGVNSKTLKEYPKWNYGTNIDKDNCIFCGRCEIYCPRGAIYVKRELPKLEDLVIGEIVTNVDKCINCHICEEMCPAEAITIETDDNINSKKFTATNIKIDKSKCVYCKICHKVCPENALKIICTTCMEQESIPKVEITGDVILDVNSCVKCSWCEKICPADAAHTIKPFEGKILFNEREDAICKGESCHACQDVCPCNAISIIDNKSTANTDVCILCGACEKVCPQNILNIERSAMNLKNIKSNSWERILGSLIG